MFWSDDDLQLLAGSPLLAAVVAQKRQAFDWHSEHIIPTIQVSQLAGTVYHADQSPESKLTALAHVCAYGLTRFTQRYPQAFGVSDGGALPEAYSLARFEWVLSMIASRAFWHYDLDKAVRPSSSPRCSSAGAFLQQLVLTTSRLGTAPRASDVGAAHGATSGSDQPLAHQPKRIKVHV
jgi:hypothetical protein